MVETFDHIVVGGGTAGCVAAARLVEDGGARVLVLEAGHSHRHPFIDMPPGVFKLLKGGSKFFKTHVSTPQPQLAGRTTEIPQGNVLGGGSSVNGQAYVRARPSDYDEWHEMLRGNNDALSWAWEDILPHYIRMEANQQFNDEFHGTEGRLPVSYPGYIDDCARWFVQSLQARGEPYNPDFNGATQRGAGYFQFIHNKGQRYSAAYAFLDPVKDNPKLTLRLQAEVQRLVIENDRAVGVVYKDKDGEKEVRADGEIILTAGAYMTPKIMMLSGLGPADHLREHGIDVVQDMPGVGQNLKDHPDASVVARANGKHGYYGQDKGLRMLLNGIEFKTFGRGRITTTGLEAACFVNPTDPDAEPSHEAYMIPVLYLDDDDLARVGDGYGMSIQVVLLKPKSVGDVRLRSADPSDMPLVNPNFLGDPEDMEAMKTGLRYFRDVMLEKPLGDRVKEIVAPANYDDDADFTAHIKRVVKTNFHPVGTTKMGADGDPMAVLDARMKVRGMEGLRVADCSIMPEITAGNTMAPAMLFGDRCADVVMGKL
ncbi:GMC family oxidoreductase N-terminal domain-containing protein [Tropicimonas sp. TH_r6]|uniref:GMC family oxidoreductase n=1 Tax=Tropicimonas sp. TH_r6 TaxID=3082085 RepID=UPI002954A36F|nr:GMC family oxidoreductase N-terminal domain-containing protein [Tropicimonas sp. TH_r6]MDV7145602.1 GMC family oxidoreductase N-terminal domain-containing protein [Tropicimonas sp. TH_r6]